METITLKEWAALLPNETILQVDEIYVQFTTTLVVANITNSFANGMSINEAIAYSAKPILYDLSWLTKPITHNGGKITPIELFNGWSSIRSELYFITRNENNYDRAIMLPYWVVEKLLELHFDVFNLIPRNLAVPITETFNPYK